MSVRDAARDIDALPPTDGDPVASEPYASAPQAWTAALAAVGDSLVDQIAMIHRGPGAPRVTIKCHGREAVSLEFTDKASAITFYELAWQQFGSLT